MSDRPPPPPYQAPPPLPQIDLKRLWISMLIPSVVSFCSILLLWAMDRSGGTLGGNGIVGLFIFMGFGILVGGILFFNCIKVRFRGSSLVLLVLAFPLLQTVIAAAVFFFGCLALMATS